jgi:hypothetical protein
MLPHMSTITEGLARENQEVVEIAKNQARLAREEIERGFPLLRSHTPVSTWGFFEVAVEDTIVNILLNEPNALKSEAFVKIKVPLAQFHLSDEESRVRFLLTEATKVSGRKQGVDAFESALGLLDLSGPVDEGLKKAIWEMDHIRNVIVHRGSCADQRIIEACPWLKLEPGIRIALNGEAVKRYGFALVDYAVVVSQRLELRYVGN